MVTRFYFHIANSGVTGTLPATEQSTLTAVKNSDAQTVNRAMDTTKGTAQTSITLTTNSTTSLQDYYFTKFVSPLIYQTSIAANTWTYTIGTRNTGSTSVNFPVSGSSQPVYVNCYVWRPSTGAKVGTVLDGNSASVYNEDAAVTTEYYKIGTFTGASVAGLTSGDAVVVMEVWFRVTASAAAAAQLAFFFDGATVSTNDATTTDCASYLETPENISLTPPSVTIPTTILLEWEEA